MLEYHVGLTPELTEEDTENIVFFFLNFKVLSMLCMNIFVVF
jgi:hypothetical protein